MEKKHDQTGKMIPIKAILISTGLAVISLFLKAYVPTAVDLSVFNSWLKPPHLFVIVNFIITIIVASSKYFHSFDEIQTDPIVHRAPEADFDFSVTFPPPITVAEVERSEVVLEVEKEEEISEVINGGDQVPSKVEGSENLSPVEKKPLVSVRSGHRKPVKSSAIGIKRKKALKVVKPKPTFESTWKKVTEELEPTPLTRRNRRPDTLGLEAGDVKPALRKSVTFRDITNYDNKSPMVVKVKEEMLPSDEELHRRVEAFIMKTKLERLESLRLDKRSSLRRKV